MGVSCLASPPGRIPLFARIGRIARLFPRLSVAGVCRRPRSASCCPADACAPAAIEMVNDWHALPPFSGLVPPPKRAERRASAVYVLGPGRGDRKMDLNFFGSPQSPFTDPSTVALCPKQTGRAFAQSGRVDLPSPLRRAWPSHILLCVPFQGPRFSRGPAGFSPPPIRGARRAS